MAVELLSLLYWGDCQDGKTSHSTRAGYVIDARTEEIAATAKWYAPGFKAMTPKKGKYMVGHKLAGVSEACELMVKAHRSAMLEQPFLKVRRARIPAPAPHDPNPLPNPDADPNPNPTDDRMGHDDRPRWAAGLLRGQLRPDAPASSRFSLLGPPVALPLHVGLATWA